MGVYNILSINALCPHCKKTTNMEFQMHFACSGVGPFILEKLVVGDKIEWIDKKESYYIEPDISGGQIIRINNNNYREKCYGKCLECKCNLIIDVIYDNFYINKTLNLRIDEENT